MGLIASKNNLIFTPNLIFSGICSSLLGELCSDGISESISELSVTFRQNLYQLSSSNQAIYKKIQSFFHNSKSKMDIQTKGYDDKAKFCRTIPYGEKNGGDS